MHNPRVLDLDVIDDPRAGRGEMKQPGFTFFGRRGALQAERQHGEHHHHYSHPEQIMQEIAALTPSFAGVNYAKIERLGSVQWPCNEHTGEAGTATSAAAGGASDVSLKGICPDKIVIQTDWNPEAEHGGILLITHYTRILRYIQPQFVHVFVDGRIVESGGAELADELEANGYVRFTQAAAGA